MPKIAVFSDIHSNVTALEAVLRDCKKQKIKRFICLGDITGYAAHPAQCLDLVRSLDCPTVKGNHDESVAAGRPHADMNRLAAAGIEYSVEHLKKADREWLRRLPARINEGEATIVHASLMSPLEWPYITDAVEAEESMTLQETPVCFFGHTHRPGIYASRSGARFEKVGPMKFRFDPKGRCMVNPGSVGQPRDGDPRAHYLVYDTRARTVDFARVPYDIEAEARSIRRAGLPHLLAERIKHGY